MIKHFGNWLKVFISIILIFTFIPVQSIASEDYVRPKVVSSSISDKIIAYKGIENPGFTTIKFKTNKPVAAYLEVYGNEGSTSIRVSEWRNKKTDYEVNFVPLDYSKALYDEFVPLPPGVYNVSVSLTDEGYNTNSMKLGTIEIVKENTEQPLVEVLDIKITNEVKDLKIEPKMKFIYRVNRPAYIQVPVFRDYSTEYQKGEKTQIDTLFDKNYYSNTGVFEVEWDLRPPMRIFQNIYGITTLQPNDKKIVSPNEYKLFFRTQEETIRKYASQGDFSELNNDVEIDILVTSNNNNTEIEVIDGWTPQKETEVTSMKEVYDITHYVTEGETLWKVSQKYDVSLEDIVIKNNLDINNHITVGQKIIIPTYIIKFDDIQNHWAKDNVKYLAARKIINGVGNNNFNPDEYVTRAEYIAMILRMLDVDVKGKEMASFKDVHPNTWYYDIVETAVKLELVSGYDDETFKPNQMITRQEMTVVVERALNLEGIQLSNVDEDVLKKYKDTDKISSWVKSSMAFATDNNIVQGKGNNLLDPIGIATRAEGATIIKRVYDYINK